MVQGEISSQEGQLLVTTWLEFEEFEFKMGIKFEATYEQISPQTKQKLFMLESPILKQKRWSEVEDNHRLEKNMER